MESAMYCETAVQSPAHLMGDAAQVELPSEVILDKKGRTLELVWGCTHATISHRVLRRSCRCSVCESQRRKLNKVLPVPDGIELLEIEPVGSVGLRLFFSDQHDRGIFPWVYLRQIAFGATNTGFSDSLIKGWRNE